MTQNGTGKQIVGVARDGERYYRLFTNGQDSNGKCPVFFEHCSRREAMVISQLKYGTEYVTNCPEDGLWQAYFTPAGLEMYHKLTNPTIEDMWEVYAQFGESDDYYETVEQYE